MNIKVYSGKAPQRSLPLSSSELDLDLVRKILSKVELNFKTEEDSFIDYPTKSNPF